MAVFIGKDQLVKTENLAKRLEDKKGIQGEIKVGNLLSQYPPDDTYLIAQPAIGKYQPDFLIVSPRYGLRMVEVKNHSLNSILNVHSNGAVITKYRKTNPLGQVKTHVEEMKSYLISNHPYLGDTHRLIGYSVVNIGFSLGDFKDKFQTQLQTWSTEQEQDFFKFHIFSDQLNEQIDTKLKSATKFTNVRLKSLTSERIKDIISNVKVANYVQDVEEYLGKLDEYDEKFNNVNDEINILKENIATYNTDTKTQGANKKKVFYLLSLCTLGLIAGIVILTQIPFNGERNNDEVSNLTPETIENGKNSNEVFTDLGKLNGQIGEHLKVKAEVTEFSFDRESGTKFLTLSDGENVIRAVIFEGTKVPYIKEGNTYLFDGYIQQHEGKTEIKVSGIK